MKPVHLYKIASLLFAYFIHNHTRFKGVYMDTDHRRVLRWLYSLADEAIVIK